MSGIDRLDANFAARPVSEGMIWADALEIGLEGKGYEDTELPYDRLPAAAKGVVSEPVWTLQRHSAGMSVRFRTDSREIGIRWSVLSRDLGMDHMPATGVSGVDLYADRDGRMRYAGTGRPHEWPLNAARFPGSPDGRPRTFHLNLPLYNGTEQVQIGVIPGSALAPAPDHPAAKRKPVCFYGTSIVQGGCASRPGMAYPAILGRALAVRTINLGFSGNGKAEPEVVELLARLDPEVWVLDPLPNMALDTLAERLENLLRVLRRAHPETPIVLVEHVPLSRLADPDLDPAAGQARERNEVARSVTARLVREGFGPFRAVGWGGLMGNDGEATVDGIHPSDLGFQRIAEAVGAVLGPLLQTRG